MKSMIQNINFINNTTRCHAPIKGIIISMEPLDASLECNNHVVSCIGQVFHDEFLLVMNQPPVELLNLVCWDQLKEQLIEHGKEDKLRRNMKLDLGITGMHNTMRTSASCCLPQPGLHGANDLSRQPWATSLFVGATETLQAVTKHAAVFPGEEMFPMNELRHKIGAGLMSCSNCIELLSVHRSTTLSDHCDKCNSDDDRFAWVLTVVQWMHSAENSEPERLGFTATGRVGLDHFLSSSKEILIFLEDVSAYFHHNINPKFVCLNRESLLYLQKMGNHEETPQLLCNMTVQSLCHALLNATLHMSEQDTVFAIGSILAATVFDSHVICSLRAGQEDLVLCEVFHMLKDALPSVSDAWLLEARDSMLALRVSCFLLKDYTTHHELMESCINQLNKLHSKFGHPLNNWDAHVVLRVMCMVGFMPSAILQDMVWHPCARVQKHMSTRFNLNINDPNLICAWKKIVHSLASHLDVTLEQVGLLVSCYVSHVSSQKRTKMSTHWKLEVLYYFNCETCTVWRMCSNGVHTQIIPLCNIVFTSCLATPQVGQCNISLGSDNVPHIDLIDEVKQLTGGAFVSKVKHVSIRSWDQRRRRRKFSTMQLLHSAIHFPSGQKFSTPSEFPLNWNHHASCDGRHCYDPKQLAVSHVHVALSYLLCCNQQRVSPRLHSLLFGHNSRATRSSPSDWWMVIKPNELFLHVSCRAFRVFQYTVVSSIEKPVKSLQLKWRHVMQQPLQHAPAQCQSDHLMHDIHSIVKMTGPHSPQDSSYNKFPYNLVIKWTTGEMTEEPLNLIWQDANVVCRMFLTSQHPSHFHVIERLVSSHGQ